MDAMNIKYLADYPHLINDVNSATAFGYSMQELTTRLQPIHSIARFEDGAFWADYTLYRLSSDADRSSSPKNR